MAQSSENSIQTTTKLEYEVIEHNGKKGVFFPENSFVVLEKAIDELALYRKKDKAVDEALKKAEAIIALGDKLDQTNVNEREALLSAVKLAEQAITALTTAANGLEKAVIVLEEKNKNLTAELRNEKTKGFIKTLIIIGLTLTKIFGL